jgi:hypothetical protein
MKRIFLLLAMIAIWAMPSCGQKSPTPEELDHQAAVKIDSTANDLNQSTEQLQKVTEDAEKSVDQLLKDI